jgi:predicted DCC family thiol-disulfide oxidoreductase YuxK
MQIKQTVILFDGICNLCNGTVDFLMKKDRKKQFRFVALQSETGKMLVQKFKIPPATESVIAIKENKVYQESDAAIEIAGMLPFPWKLGKVLKVIPKKLRDYIYRVIAKNRYKWFGKTESCRIITEENTMMNNVNQE